MKTEHVEEAGQGARRLEPLDEFLHPVLRATAAAAEGNCQPAIGREGDRLADVFPREAIVENVLVSPRLVGRASAQAIHGEPRCCVAFHASGTFLVSHVVEVV